jgi:hypothetical protein
MKIPILLLIMCTAFMTGSFGQVNTTYNYEASTEFPFGQVNPNAPEQTSDFEDLIGECKCQSVARGTDQKWGDTVAMTWRFKYIMNGNAVQDETLKEDGRHSGSIRQFDADSLRWNVHFYSNSSFPAALPTWGGSKNELGDIVLYRSNVAPDGTPGFYRITFFDIKSSGFNWIGEWINTDATIVYPMWKIACSKQP